MRRMLAVTHEATLTGAPMNLLNLLRWIRTNTLVDVHTLVLKDGPLRSQFEKVGGVSVVDADPGGALMSELHRGLVHMGSRRLSRITGRLRFARHLADLRDFDLVYLNSITSAAALPFLPDTPVVVSHVHELQVALRSWVPSRDRDLFLDRPDCWIAASEAVRSMLVDEFALPPERVLLHHEFIDPERMLNRKVTLREVARIRRIHAIPEDAAVVMGAGTIDWRKGPDLFIQLATEVRRRSSEPVHFVWVGGDLTGTDMNRLHSDMERSGADHVHFVGTHLDPLPYFAVADVFALTSREDPYPLVCLEHALLGNPIVAYRNGGIVELLESSGPEAAAGLAVYLDVGSLADQVLRYLEFDDHRIRAGQQLREYVLAHHDAAVAAPRLFADLDRLMKSVSPAVRSRER